MSSQFDNYKAQCAKAIEHFKRDLGRLRSGRATPTLLEGLQVEYYGSMVPLQQLGLVAAPESRMLTYRFTMRVRLRVSRRLFDNRSLALIHRVMGG